MFVPPEGAEAVHQACPRRKSWRREGGSRQRRSDDFAFETVNGTGWGPIAEYAQLLKGTDVLMFQETHVPPARVPSEEDWLRARRLRGALSGATQSSAGGWQGGVGIAVRDAYGLSLFPGQKRAEIVPGRAAAMHMGAFIAGGITISTVYLWTSEGLSARNLEILEALGAFLRRQGTPFVIAGDWNIPPPPVGVHGLGEAPQGARRGPRAAHLCADGGGGGGLAGWGPRRLQN